VNQRQGAEIRLIPLKIAGDGAATGAEMFIVQGKPREPEGIVKVTKDTRKDALERQMIFSTEDSVRHHRW
jgi:hypothetical protein